MNEIASHLADYLNETLSVSLSPIPWEGVTRLPPFLMHRYCFLRAKLIDKPVLFMVDSQADEETPVTIHKHIAQIQLKWDQLVIYVRNKITAYNRKRLIQHHIPFIVPGTQLYIPELALDLREYYRKPHIEKSPFSPSTQAVFIHALLRTSSEPLTAIDLAPQLGYSAMTISRAFDEMEGADLAESKSNGKNRCLYFKAPWRELWQQAQPLLRSPIKHHHYINSPPSPDKILGPLAGLSALARYSMLNEPNNPTFAVSYRHWKLLLRQQTINELPLRETNSLEIEVWIYPPKPYRKKMTVDPLSLYLSLENTTDERIESALEHMMRTLPW